PRTSIAIVGGGVAGLVCARRLAEAGARVLVLDRGRTVGGRLAPRRAGALQFDHGAQYFTARQPAFAAQAALWARHGLAAGWDGRLVVLERGPVAQAPGGVRRWVGVPGMGAIAEALGDDARMAGAELDTGIDVAGARFESGRWRLSSTESLSRGSYDAP